MMIFYILMYKYMLYTSYTIIYDIYINKLSHFRLINKEIRNQTIELIGVS